MPRVRSAKVAEFTRGIGRVPDPALDERQGIERQRSALPIAANKTEIERFMGDPEEYGRVLIVEGETGCGKTTQLVQFIWDFMSDQYNAGKCSPGLIGCTQPRRISTVSATRQVAKEVGCEVGSEVGYTMRFDDQTTPTTVIKYMTDGILWRELIKDPCLTDYFCVVLDEAHMRTINSDLLLAALKTTVEKRRDFRLIVCSATLNTRKLIQYFDYKAPHHLVPVSPPVVQVRGRNFETRIVYSKKKISVGNAVMHAALQACKIVDSGAPGDMLIFLPGQEEINQLCAILEKRGRNTPSWPPLVILPLYGVLPDDEQHRVFQPTPSGQRKIIVATNIAETSLTVDGIVFVIDTGYLNVMRFCPFTGFHRLRAEPISKCSANQRAGRAGRTRDGVCYRMYTQKQYDNMHDGMNPEILCSDLSSMVLNMIAMRITNIPSYHFIQAPHWLSLRRAFEDLKSWNAINDRCELTSQGRKMIEFPLDPALSSLLIVSEMFNCSDEMAIIVAAISADVLKLFDWPRNENDDPTASSKIEDLQDDNGDHLTLLNVYRKWIKANRSRKWCKENRVQYATIKNIDQIVRQLRGIMHQQRVTLKSCGRDTSRVQAALASCFSHNAAFYVDKEAGYRWLGRDRQGRYGHVPLNVPKNSVIHRRLVAATPRPQSVVICQEVVEYCSRRTMHIITEVSADMLPVEVRSRLSSGDHWRMEDPTGVMNLSTPWHELYRSTEPSLNRVGTDASYMGW